MSRARNRRLPVVRALALLGLAGTWAVACGGPQSLGASGAVCFRSDDCQAGLACVPEAPGSSKHLCSADLSGIVSTVDGAAPEAGATPDANGGAAGSVEPGTGGEPSGAGGPADAGTSGNPATAGGAGTAGSGTAGVPAGGSGSAGGPAGGAPAGGSASAGGPAGGASGAGNGGAGVANGGASAGTAG